MLNQDTREAVERMGMDYRYYCPPYAEPVVLNGFVDITPTTQTDDTFRAIETGVSKQEILVIHEYSLEGFETESANRISEIAGIGKLIWSIGQNGQDNKFGFQSQMSDSANKNKGGLTLLRKNVFGHGNPPLVIMGTANVYLHVNVIDISAGQDIGTGWTLAGTIKGYKFSVPQSPTNADQTKLMQSIERHIESIKNGIGVVA